MTGHHAICVDTLLDMPHRRSSLGYHSLSRAAGRGRLGNGHRADISPGAASATAVTVALNTDVAHVAVNPMLGDLTSSYVLQDLVQYWRTDFNWGKQQRWLNTHFHNFKMEVLIFGRLLCCCPATGCSGGCYTWHWTGNAMSSMQVDGINMHFVHHKSELPNARPILLIHGWPGSFIEFHAIIPKLTAAGYDVVAPSLPGYAFSSPPTR